jgi:hypothetical protein
MHLLRVQRESPSTRLLSSFRTPTLGSMRTAPEHH